MGGDGLAGLVANMVFDGPSPLSTLRAKAPNAKVTFLNGAYPKAAADAARQADIAIVFANQWMGEGADAPDLSLPNGQETLIAAVTRANPHTIVVLETGGPVRMPWLNQAGAVLEAWYPGSGGAQAIADVLFGDVDATGRLPMTFPASQAQLPAPKMAGLGLPEDEAFDMTYPEGADAGYRWYAAKGRKPLFPFGFGLSYTQFSYGALKVEGGLALKVSFDVTNTGRRPGGDTPQVYLTGRNGRSLMRLIGWSRVSLQPGETRHVTVKADPRLLADFSEAAHRWRVDAGTYRIAIGASSDAPKLVGAVSMVAADLKP
jgi:beta-glucosidase